MLHQALRTLAALTCFAGAALIYSSMSGPHLVLFKNHKPPVLPGIPDVSVWLGLWSGEAVIDTRITPVSVEPFGYDQTLICRDLCQRLHDGGLATSNALLVASVALVVAATLAAVALTPLPNIKLPASMVSASHALQGRCDPFTATLTACITAVIIVVGGMISWFAMLHELLAKSAPDSSQNSPSIRLSKDMDMFLGESAWMIIAGLACTVAGPVFLSVSRAYEKLNYLERELYYQQL